MTTNTQRTNRPRATCAWCRRDFDSIVDLIDHVDLGHLDPVKLAS